LYTEFHPIVSIILPTFNRLTYLKRSIDSVIAQTYKNWELLVVDDGSNDKTYEFVDNLMRGNENIRYLKHKNRKLPLTLNAGILAACGKYISFIGSDDEWKTEHLKLRMDILETDKLIDLIYGGVEVIGDPMVSDKNDLSKKIHLNDCIVGGTFLGKKELFTKLKGFKNIKYSEDSEFFERVKTVSKIRKVDFKTYLYHRNTPGSITNTF
jgi:glycosyltransferase involved in cell wall biosynthesis